MILQIARIKGVGVNNFIHSTFTRIGYEIDEFQIKSESISFSQEANPRVIDKEKIFQSSQLVHEYG